MATHNCYRKTAQTYLPLRQTNFFFSRSHILSPIFNWISLSAITNYFVALFLMYRTIFSFRNQLSLIGLCTPFTYAYYGTRRMLAWRPVIMLCRWEAEKKYNTKIDYKRFGFSRSNSSINNIRISKCIKANEKTSIILRCLP